MTPQELNQFGTMVNDAISMYRAPLNDRALNMFVSLFVQYSFNDCVQALEQCCRECKFAPNPSALLAILNNNRDEKITENARRWWMAFLSLHVNSSCDIVTDDVRALEAFIKSFGSLSLYLKSNIDDAKALEKFVDNYVKVKQRLSGEKILSGDSGKSPSVKFIGDYYNCLRIAKEHYKHTNKEPYYPLDPNLKPKIEFTAKGKIFDEHGQQITAERVKELINNFIDQALDLTNPYKR